MTVIRRALRLRSAQLSLALLVVVLLVGVFGGWLAPQDPLAQDTANILHGPSSAHWLGTDYLGRDVFSRLIDGTGRSVFGALEAVLVGMLLGIPAGLASVQFGRVLEWLSLRFIDSLMTLPWVVFAVAVAGILGNGPNQAMLTIGVLLSAFFYRITRAAALGLAGAQYVEMAELLGASRSWVIRVHVWTKVLPTIAVTAANCLAAALLTVSSLTFLGIGVQPPAATWGGVLSGDLSYLSQQPWAPVLPSLLIVLTVAACNALADAIRDTSGVGGGSALSDPAEPVGPAQPIGQPIGGTR
jgi:peptide/nickel transport system permease protein